MELYFNELSIDHSIPMEYVFISNLNEVYIRSKQEGFSVCRLSVTDKRSLIDYLSSNSDLRNVRTVTNFAYAFFASPCESTSSDLQENQFIESNWNYEGKACGGLVWAYIHDTLALSIASTDWLGSEVSLVRKTEAVLVHHISQSMHFDDHRLWLESLKAVSLLISPLTENEKKISLRDDHGRDILFDLAKRMRRSPYVVGIVNSLPFNPYCRTFVRKIHPNGIVELVLTWTDKGIGLAVQTTGRNYRETLEIAKILTEEFGYR